MSGNSDDMPVYIGEKKEKQDRDKLVKKIVDDFKRDFGRQPTKKEIDKLVWELTLVDVVEERKTEHELERIEREEKKRNIVYIKTDVKSRIKDLRHSIRDFDYVITNRLKITPDTKCMEKRLIQYLHSAYNQYEEYLIQKELVVDSENYEEQNYEELETYFESLSDFMQKGILYLRGLKNRSRLTELIRSEDGKFLGGEEELVVETFDNVFKNIFTMCMDMSRDRSKYYSGEKTGPSLNDFREEYALFAGHTLDSLEKINKSDLDFDPSIA